jgi:hypothetical protein
MRERFSSSSTVSVRSEKLFEFLRGHDRILCELVDDGPVYGVDVQFFTSEEIVIGRTFPAYPDAARTPREMAIAWAEAERKAIDQAKGRDAD